MTSLLRLAAVLAGGLLLPFIPELQAQTVPTFRYEAGGNSYTLVGSDPATNSGKELAAVLVPVVLTFESSPKEALNASGSMQPMLASPVFSDFAYPNNAGKTQWADALLRSTFPGHTNWHTRFGKPEVHAPVQVRVPAADGYLLSSRSTGRHIGIADIEFVQKEVFKQVPKQEGKLVFAITENTAFYSEGDATICCLWGTHGVDSTTGNSFVLASYLKQAPSIVKEDDVQPITQQLTELLYDPLHDPSLRQNAQNKPGNQFPRWLRPDSMRPGDQGRCGGNGIASAYFLLEPTDINRKNNFPYSPPFTLSSGARQYHVQNVALLSWYLGAETAGGKAFSFPDPTVLPSAAKACPEQRSQAQAQAPQERDVKPVATAGNAAKNGHKLIGYWTGSGRRGAPLALHDVSPQWDVIIVAFAAPVKGGPEGTLHFELPQGITEEQLKADIAQRKAQGKSVLISLGGGGAFFSLDAQSSIPNFVGSISKTIRDFGSDGVDIDFESPSLVIADGDTDYKHPKTPSIVNLLAGLRQLHDEFGPKFMISLVPEGPQFPAGHPTYGGQFGSYLPLAYGLHDMLSFLDVQDYNTPPLQGLDGEIYQAGTVDYHAATTELVLRGFSVGNTGQKYEGLAGDKVAVGYLIGETSPEVVDESMRYIITGQKPAGTTYQLRKKSGYGSMIGAMFWTIDADAQQDYQFSNRVGPLLHGFKDGSGQ